MFPGYDTTTHELDRIDGRGTTATVTDRLQQVRVYQAVTVSVTRRLMQSWTRGRHR